jgi:hypothetical protein
MALDHNLSAAAGTKLDAVVTGSGCGRLPGEKRELAGGWFHHASFIWLVLAM